MQRKICLYAFSILFGIGSVTAGCSDSTAKTKKSSEKITASESPNESAAFEKTTLQVWEMPDELKEISANVLIDEKRMACVQDNKGIIYIYNLETKSVETRIHFAGKGDYEGLAVVNNTYYVLRSDGFIFEVNPVNGSAPSVKTYDLPLDVSNETESLFYDKTKNRLLVAVKERDLTAANTKGVYSFDLSSKKMNTTAVMQIGAGDNSNEKKGKKGAGGIKPSDLAIHPSTGEFYILNGHHSELIIATPAGAIIKTIQLDKKIFPQPEGLCFNASGQLYISSEGSKRTNGIIARVDY